MSQQTAFFPLEGALDMTTPAIAARSGRARLVLNYEPDPSGFRRVAGYERYDGRQSPTDAFDAEADPVDGAVARDAARTAITAVPGSGPVRGVWYYNGNVYAVRDNAGGTAGIMHVATAGGWSALTLSRSLQFTSGGATEIVEGNVITGATSGAMATVQRVILTSGTWAGGTAVGYLTLSGQVGNFVAENLNVGASLNVATVAGNSAAATLPAGGRYEFLNFNFYGASNLFRMYGCNGVGKAFEFDGTNFTFITTGMVVDTPHRIAAHRRHLFLAFPGGSLQHSATGEPLSWSPILGAAELGIGDEITDLLLATTENLAILGLNSVSILYGNDATDWELRTLSDDAGALPWTADKVGGVLYMDSRGVRRMEAAQEYGNFRTGTLTQQIEPYLARKRLAGVQPCAASRSRTRDLYRLFFDDGTGLAIYLGGKYPAITTIDLGKVLTTICAAETEDGSELILFGSDDGFVYRLDKGRSFDGEEITYYLRLPFNHLGAPQVNKRWHKVMVECSSAPTTTLGITGEVDYADADEPSLPSQVLEMSGGGGFWDDAVWDQFYWSSAVEGVATAYIDVLGKNLSLLIVGATADEDPHLLQGVTLFYSVRGLRR